METPTPGYSTSLYGTNAEFDNFGNWALKVHLQEKSFDQGRA